MSKALSNKINSWVQDQIQPQLLSLVKYYNGQLYDITVDDSQQLVFTPSQSTKTIKFLIVARQHYQESVESYPIDNIKELKKVLALKYNAQPNTKYLLSHTENEQSKVNVWQFSSNIPSALFTLPETLLLAHQIKHNELLTVKDKQNENLYVSNFNGLVYSSTTSSLVKNSIIFALSAGIAPESEHVINRDALPAVFSFPFTHFPLSHLAHFTKPIKSMLPSSMLKWIFVPIVSIFLLNMLGVSAYVSYKEHSLESEMAQYSDKFSTMLNNQQQMDENYQRYTSISQFFNDQPSHLPLLMLLPDLFPKARFSNIRFDKGRYVLRGLAPNALNILTFMNNHPEIDDAKFDFPINKGGKQEFFVISFKSVSFKQLMQKQVAVTNGASTNE